MLLLRALGEVRCFLIVTISLFPLLGSLPVLAQSLTDTTSENSIQYDCEPFIIQKVPTGSEDDISHEASASNAPTNCLKVPPPVPNAPAVSSSGLTLNVVWSHTTNANYYFVQQSVNHGAWQSAVASTTSTKAFTGVSGSAYKYRVSACNDWGCSPYSSISNTVTLVAVPAVPKGLSPTLLTGAINVMWNASANTTSYRIRQSVNGGWQTEINKNTTRTHSFSVSPGNSYQYQVRACGAAGCSAWSAATAAIAPPAIPAVPVGLNASQAGLTINTAWNASSNATSYLIRQSVNGSWQGEINKGTARSHSFTATPGSTYQYQVRACGQSGCSAWSAVTAAITPPAIPAIPGGLTAPLSALTINTAWNAASNATSYPAECEW